MGWKRLVPSSSLCLISATATPMGGGGGRFGSAQDLGGLALLSGASCISATSFAILFG
jgi:hypothetical protein